MIINYEFLTRIVQSLMIASIVVWIAYKLSYHQYERLKYFTSGIDRSVRIISNKASINCNYTIWREKNIIYRSDNIIFDKIFHLLFPGSNNSSKKISGKILIKEKNYNRLTAYSLIQHPVNRFLDNFMRYCQRPRKWNEIKCLNCFSDTECIITKLYNRIEKKSKHERVLKNVETDTIFLPYSWSLNFNISKNIIFNLENTNQFQLTIYNELLDFNTSSYVINEVLNIAKNFTSEYENRKNNINGKRKLIEKSLYFNKPLMRKFVSMYFDDFKVFGFNIPQF